MWFCCKRSLTCRLDTVLHELNIHWRWLCLRHDARITGGTEPPLGYTEVGVLEDKDGDN